jgi:hypothetical protein
MRRFGAAFAFGNGQYDNVPLDIRAWFQERDRAEPRALHLCGALIINCFVPADAV